LFYFICILFLDIWSLGVLLYTLIYQENPYLQEDFYSKPLQIPFILSEGKYIYIYSIILICEYINIILLIKINNFNESDSLDLLRWMLNKDPSCRPTIKEILNHPWLKD